MATRDDKENDIWIWRQNNMLNNGCGTSLYVAVIIAIVFVLSSCSTKSKIEYVDREVIRYETKVEHDTLILNTHDSVFHSVIQKGDTIYEKEYVEKTKWRDRIVVKSDTCWRDSIVTEYKEKTREVVKYPKSYWYSVGISILFFIFAFVKLIKFLKWH